MNGHRLIEKIGGGAFGEVWRADLDGRPVAVKILRRRPRSREVLAQVALGRLTGPDARFFPRVEEADLESDPPWLRMELVEGRPLETVLAGLTLPQRLDLGLRLLEALDAVHRHDFVHGDLSPNNVLVTRDGVKLIDVGFGRIFDGVADPVPSGTAEEADSFGVASPLYAAPERFRAEFLDGCGKSSDLFSFGKILYRLVTGESPHVVKPTKLGAKWDEFLFRCLEEKPEARFANAGEALAAYRALSERPDIVFCDDVPDIEFLEAKKTCPACKEPIVTEAKKCRHCGVWLLPPAKPAVPARSFVGAAWLTFFAYGLLWLPGAILNCVFLSDAKSIEKETGRPPEGMLALQVLVWLGVYLPLGGLAVLMILGILSSLFS